MAMVDNSTSGGCLDAPARVRLAALNAYYQDIRPEFRRISALRKGSEIEVTVTLDRALTDELADHISKCNTLIIAEFSGDETLDEIVLVETGPLDPPWPAKDGTIYDRWDGPGSGYVVPYDGVES